MSSAELLSTEAKMSPGWITNPPALKLGFDGPE
jgi:hypothetical protein